MDFDKVELLKWSDIKSKTMNTRDYLEFIQSKKSALKNHDDYQPKAEIIQKTQELLSKTAKYFRVLAIGAEWCGDCSKNVPRMVKIIEAINNPKMEFKILYGVMVNPLKKREGHTWHEKRSPPEAVNPKFDLKAIPTFFFFIDEVYVGRVIEEPQRFETFEEELLHALESNL